MLTVRFADAPSSSDAPLALPIASGGDLRARLAAIDPTGVLRHAAEAARFEGEAGGIVEAFVPGAEGSVRRMLLVGIGAAGAGQGAALEKAGAAIVARLLTAGVAEVVVDVSGLPDSAHAAARVAFGATLRAWRHDAYRTKLPAKSKPTLAELTVVGGGPEVAARWAPLAALAEGMAFTRELVTEPANVIYPESFVARCEARFAGLDVGIEILDEAAMRELGMGALLGVSQGSAREARILCLTWTGAADDKAPVAFVGKGVTFDSGGISLKPGGGMEDMKWDMGGAGAVAGAMLTLARRGAKANVIGVCGLVENMPDGEAQRPGDVVTTMSGQTVEVINTDAEGRLVLADVLTWVQRTKRVKTIVDLATLTGAMITSLGHEQGGLFANDDTLADQLLSAGRASGDPLWRFPMGEAYDKLIDSPIADMKNVGPREAGSITAAQFIQRYVEEGVRWAHLDIAGMVWTNKPGALWDKGATGFGVRLLDRFVADVLEG